MDQQPKSAETISPEILEQKGRELQELDLEYVKVAAELRRLFHNAEAWARGMRAGIEEPNANWLIGISDRKEELAVQVRDFKWEYGLQVDPDYAIGKTFPYKEGEKFVTAIITIGRILDANGNQVVPFEFDIIENSAARR